MAEDVEEGTSGTAARATPEDIASFLREEAERITSYQVQAIVKNGEGKIGGSAFVYDSELESHRMEFNFESDEERRLKGEQVRDLAASIDAVGAVITVEAWMVAADAPARQPHRTCVVSTVMGPGLPVKALVTPIETTLSNELHAKESQWADEAVMFLVERWWKDGDDEGV